MHVFSHMNFYFPHAIFIPISYSYLTSWRVAGADMDNAVRHSNHIERRYERTSTYIVFMQWKKN